MNPSFLYKKTKKIKQTDWKEFVPVNWEEWKRKISVPSTKDTEVWNWIRDQRTAEAGGIIDLFCE